LGLGSWVLGGDLVNERNPEAIEEIYPPDFVWHEPDGDIQGYEQARQLISTFFAGFPDINNISVEDVIAEGACCSSSGSFPNSVAG
jgi:hypothetical protein